MNFTFGIITAGNIEHLRMVIESIYDQKIDSEKYEIIVVGGPPVSGKNIVHIDFNEQIKEAWITKKKNLITDNAKFDNIVYMHDYIILNDDWYKGWVEFGENYSVCMNVILNQDGTRYRDWCIWPHNHNWMDGIMAETRECLLSYDEDGFSDYMYFSGAYWVAKKDAMQEFPLDERLSWGGGEDVLWSKQIRSKHKFVMNKNSCVQLLKQKDKAFNYMSQETLNRIKNQL